MFDKSLIDKDGHLPKLFTSGLLKPESSLDQLQNQINRYVPTIDAEQRVDTSLDSQMEDTPANYDSIN